MVEPHLVDSERLALRMEATLFLALERSRWLECQAPTQRRSWWHLQVRACWHQARWLPLLLLPPSQIPVHHSTCSRGCRWRVSVAFRHPRPSPTASLPSLHRSAEVPQQREAPRVPLVLQLCRSLAATCRRCTIRSIEASWSKSASRRHSNATHMPWYVLGIAEAVAVGQPTLTRNTSLPRV